MLSQCALCQHPENILQIISMFSALQHASNNFYCHSMFTQTPFMHHLATISYINTMTPSCRLHYQTDNIQSSIPILSGCYPGQHWTLFSVSHRNAHKNAPIGRSTSTVSFTSAYESTTVWVPARTPRRIGDDGRCAEDGRDAIGIQAK